MGSVATLSRVQRAIGEWSPAELLLMRRTVAKDCNEDEFDQFITIAKGLKLSPLKRQIYAFVFGKDDPDKRNMVIVIGINGFRTIADRTGNYRPDPAGYEIVYDDRLKSPSNPLGIEHAKVAVFKHVHGEWWPVAGIAHWDAYAPIVEGGTWQDDPNGGTYIDKKGKERTKRIFTKDSKKALDPNKTRWLVDPRGMIAKCAEAQALRRAWPDDFSGVYGEEEIDASQALDLTASEIAEQAAVENRLEIIQGKDTILIDFIPEGLKPVPIGTLADRCFSYFKEQKDDAEAIAYWRDANKYGLQEFWARCPSDALEVKKKIESIIAAGQKSEPAQASAGQ